MRRKLFNYLIGFTLFLVPCILLSQTAPNLGTASSFVLFTSSGNVSNSGGASTVTGDVGTNSGTYSSLGTVNGGTYNPGPTTAQAAADVNTAYSFLSGVACSSTIAPGLGGGQVLFPNVYCVNAASTLSGTLTLDGQGNPNAIFIIKINSGGLTVSNNAKVILTNSASICNVYWYVNGPVTMGMSSIFRGTILANGLISIDNMASLFGRGLTRGGNITTKNNTISISLPPVASVISASGSTTFCAGGSVVLSGNSGGTWSTGLTTPSITVTSTGTYYVTNTSLCGSINSNSITVVVNPLPTVTVNSGTICNGNSITLTANGANTYSWAPGASLSATSGTTVSASPTVSTIYTVTGTSSAGCVKTATSSVTVVQNPTITVNSTSICAGTSKTLSATGAVTYTWNPPTGLSSVNGASVIANPTVTTTYTISGTNAAGCIKSTVATVTVVSNPTLSVGSGTICSGSSTTLTASGANTFSWSPATGLNSTTSASVIANPTITTTYTITGTTAGCANTKTTTLTVNPLPTATIAASGPTTFCRGDSVILTSSPGTSYLWSTTATTQSISVSTSGSYSVMVTDANGCSAISAAQTIVVNPTPTISVNSGSICAGSSLTLTANGADTYSWSPGTGLDNTTGTSVVASPTLTTVYTTTGTVSATGCSSSTTSTVMVVPNPTLSVNSATICEGSSATLTAIGATGFTWSPGASLNSTNSASVIANPTITTIYTVTGSTDGCASVETATVSVNALPTASISAGGPVAFCQGDSVILTSSIGSSYLWSNSAVTQSISVLNSGNYSVTVTDANGCSATSSVVLVTVNPLPIVTVNDGFVCSGESVTLTANGAATYSWSPGTGLSSTVGSSVIATPASSIMYTVTGTSSDGCISTATSSVTAAAPIILTINSASMCIGSSATLTANGADTYSWNPSTELSATSGSVVIASPTVTTIYTITGTVGTCSVTNTSTVTIYSLPIVSITAGGPTTFCEGDSVSLTSSVGSSYLWSNSATTQSISVSTQGNYSVTVTDANGCSATSSVVVVTVNTLPIATIAAMDSTTFCQGDSVILVSSPGASYLWSTSATTQSITVYSGGNYSVTVTGANGCMATSGITTVVVKPLPTATISAGGPLVFCQGDSVILTSSIGSSYLWSNSATTQSISVMNSGDYSVTVTGPNGCSATSSVISVTVNPLPLITVNDGFVCSGASATLTAIGASTYSWSPGTGLSATTGSEVIASPGSSTGYTITGTSADGCVSTTTSSVTVAPAITLTINSASICIGSSTTLTAQGANTFSWSPSTGLNLTNCAKVIANPTVTTVYTITGTAGTCSVANTSTVTVNPLPVVSITAGGPTTFCDGDSVALTSSAGSSYMWSNSATTQSISVSTQGNYSVTVTDANGCSATSSVVAVTVNPLPIATITANNPTTFCQGDSVILTSSPGVSYLWSNSATTQSITVYSGGNYSVTVTGANGCMATSGITTVIVNPLPTATVSVGGPLVFCQGDSVILASSMGSIYLWSNSATTQSISVMASGDYSVTVTDGNGCSATSSVISVTVNPLPVIIVNNGFVCSGESVTLTVNGANTYSWSPGTGLSATTGSSVVASPAGSTEYTVTGTSTDGCISTSTSSVTVAPAITLTVNSDSICIGSTATLTANGANTYSWDPSTDLNATSGSVVIASPTVTTIYTITGTVGSCSVATTATVTVNALPVVSITAGGPTTFCAGDSVSLTSSAGSSYAWSNSATTQSISVLTQGDYSVTVTDTNGCSATSSIVTVTVNPLPIATITASGSTTFCQGDSVTLTSSPGVSYLWSTSATTQSITVFNSGNYSVTVTGANGCMATGIVTVVVNQLPTATVSVGGPLVFCQGDSVILTSSIGNSYLWSNTATTQSISVTTSGDYSVTVTDGNGCSATSSAVSVTVNPLPVINVNDGFVCSSGSVTLTASGANTYSWSPGTGLSATTGSSVVASPAGSMVYTVTGTNTDGCISTSISSVTVAPTITLTVNSASLCIGSSATLTASGANTYSWSPAIGLDVTSGSMVIANPTVTTVYTITGTAGTCSATNTATVTVNSLPVVSINVGGPTTFCAGDSVALTSSAASSYLWSNSTTTQSISVSTPGNYSVTITDINGCSATSSVVVVTVNPLPTISANDGYICNSGSALLTATGADTYTWSPAVALSATNGSTVTASPTVNTTYTLMGTNSNGCVNQTTISVSIVPNLTLTANSATICEGNSATLSANGATNYTWSPAFGLNTTTGASVTANPTITTTYTITGSGGNCTFTTTAIVTVDPIPNATVSADGPLIFCQGDSVVLTSGIGSSYLWSNNATTQSIVVNGSGNYSVEVTGANGCSATSPVVVVVVNPIPSVSITASGSTTICQGENVILSASPGSSYLWSNSATTQDIMVSSDGNYTVKVTDGNGCSATSAVTSVSVNLTPTIAVNVNGPTTFCQGNSVILTASSAAGYLWSNSDTTQSIVVTTGGDYSVTITDSNGCMANSSVTTVSVNPAPFVDLGTDTTVCGCILLNAYNPGASYSWSNGADYSMINVCLPGTYWVNVSNGICITRDTIHVVAYSKPLVNISIVSGTVTTLNAGNPGASYLWNTGETTQTIIADSAGKYYVTVTNQFGCEGSDTLAIGIVGIKEVIDPRGSLKIYPNPSNGVFTIEVQDDRPIEITNLLGETIRELSLVKGKNIISLDDQADGIYFVKIRYENGQEVIKIVKDN